MKTWIRDLSAAGLVVGGFAGMARAQAPAQPPPAAPDNRAMDVAVPIHNLRELETSGRMLFKLADTNNDGQISQKEATDAGNLLVGGYFFRADKNGDGVLSQDEAKAARDSLYQAQPLLRYVLERGKAELKAEKGNEGSAADPAVMIGRALDTNHDKQLQATEVRQAVESAVQNAFAMADTNRDNLLSPTEINAAMIGVGRAAVQTAFQQADADKNGTLSRTEFDKAIVEPANVVFAILDGNSDGQISPDELSQAQRIVGGQLKALMVPEPPNSVRNLIRTGASPDQVAPVPAVAPRR